MHDSTKFTAPTPARPIKEATLSVRKRARQPYEPFLGTIVEPGPPYLVPLPGGASQKAPDKDYPLAVRKRAREIVKARWDKTSRSPTNSAAPARDPYLKKPLAVRQTARELARQKLDRKFPPK